VRYKKPDGTTFFVVFPEDVAIFDCDRDYLIGKNSSLSVINNKV